MTANQIYEVLKSQVDDNCSKEDVLRKKYGERYESLRKKAEQLDYVKTILAEPILSTMSHDERNIFNSTLFKTVPMFAINAFAIKADNGEYLIVLNERLLSLIYSYHQIQFLSAYNFLNGNADKCFAKYFSPLINCYLAPESDSTLQVYDQDEFPVQQDMAVYLLTVANEQFVLAHELAHIYLKHLDGINKTERFSIGNFINGANTIEQEKEFAADIQAVGWLHNLIQAKNSKIPLAMYIEVFVLFHLIECNCGFPDMHSSHPSALARLHNIKNQCANCFEEQDVEFIDNMIINCSDINSFII